MDPPDPWIPWDTQPRDTTHHSTTISGNAMAAIPGVGIGDDMSTGGGAGAALLARTIPSGAQSLAALARHAQAMQHSPHSSHVRINTYGVPTMSLPVFLAQAAVQLRSHLAAGFQVMPLRHFPHLLQVDAVAAGEAVTTMATLVPHPRQVIVSVLCAQSLLRGAHLFAPGVLRVEETREDSSDACVSVWADTQGNCLRGGAKVPSQPHHHQ